MGRPRSPTSSRFWCKVEKGPGCWIWQAKKNKGGYGRFRDVDTGKMVPATRISLLLSGVSIPSGLMVLHHCDMPSCVRPDHLYLGTHADNMRDRRLRQRQARGESIAGPMRASWASGTRALRKLETFSRGVGHGMAELDEASVRLIRAAMADGESWAELGRRFGVAASTVRRAGLRICWAHVE